MPAPSDRIADIVLALCKTQFVQGSALLKQTCWLSFGAVVGELQQQMYKVMGVKTHMIPESVLPKTKLELYKEVGFHEPNNTI